MALMPETLRPRPTSWQARSTASCLLIKPLGFSYGDAPALCDGHVTTNPAVEPEGALLPPNLDWDPLSESCWLRPKERSATSDPSPKADVSTTMTSVIAGPECLRCLRWGCRTPTSS